jgi:uncharacterized membrane protein
MDGKTSGTIFVNGIGIALLAVQWIYFIYLYSLLPDRIPTHFNASGQADVFGSRETAWALPAISTFLFLALGYLARFPNLLRHNHTSETGRVYTGHALMMIRWMKVSIVFLFTGILLYIHLTVVGAWSEGKGWFMPLLLVISFAPLSPFIYRAWQSGKK